jgi:mannose-1-phosphate guanylyltransferase/phosphomannomutase
MIAQAVILAGGKGTRLGALSATTPKALIELAGVPLIVRQFEVLKRYGVSRVLILSGYLGDELAAALGDGSRYGLSIQYLKEPSPLGTAGALKSAEALLDRDFYVVYGDIIFDMDLGRLATFHLERESIATLVVHPNDHPQDSDLVEVDGDGQITAFHRKTRRAGGPVPNLVNAGIYVLSRRVAAFIEAGTFADFGLDIFPAMVRSEQRLFAYNTPEFMKDVGTPGRREAVEQDIVNGKVARRNIGNKQAAVFIDRDGVLIEESGDAVTAEAVVLLPGVTVALKALNKSDYLGVVVTNQPGIAKGFVTEAQVAGTHAQIDTLLGTDGAFVHGYFVCPHHPEKGFAGERVELKIDCDCRKPKPGLLLQAAERYNIDLGRSFIVGDRTIDIEAGRRAGVRTIGVRTGYGCGDGTFEGEPDFMCDDLAAAVQLILEQTT